MSGAVPELVDERLDALLAAAADGATRDHWTRYLKGTARFRGVPMAGVRRTVRTLWRDHDLAGHDTDALLGLAHRWFARPDSEDKLAAVLLVAEHLADRLDDDHDAALLEPLVAGHVGDWNVCDWYATKALHAYLVAGDPAARVPRLVAWTGLDGLWVRRAGLVALVNLAPSDPPPFPGFAELVLEACAANLVDPDRFAHTGPGWVLRELSRVDPERVADFVAAHPELSSEGRRMATARLRSGPYRRR